MAPTGILPVHSCALPAQEQRTQFCRSVKLNLVVITRKLCPDLGCHPANLTTKFVKDTMAA